MGYESRIIIAETYNEPQPANIAEDGKVAWECYARYTTERPTYNVQPTLSPIVDMNLSKIGGTAPMDLINASINKVQRSQKGFHAIYESNGNDETALDRYGDPIVAVDPEEFLRLAKASQAESPYFRMQLLVVNLEVVLETLALDRIVVLHYGY